MQEEEARLVARVKECHELKIAASSALIHPSKSMLADGAEYRKLVEDDKTARSVYSVALAELHAYHKAQKERADLL